MSERITGYWILSWIGLISNIVALPVITLVVIYGPPLRIANMTLAISLGWPAAIVGIISSAALLAERKWGVTLTLISLSMVIAGSLPYSIFRLISIGDFLGLGGVTFVISVLNVMALIYWCLPNHKRRIRF